MTPDESIVRRFYFALVAMDWDAARSCFTPDAMWHVPGQSRIAGDHRGWDSIRNDFLGQLAPMSDGTFRAELIDILVGSNHVAALQHATAKRADKHLDLTACQVMTFRNGRIAEVRGHYSDQYELDRFWS